MTLGILCAGQGDQSAEMFDILADDPAALDVLRRAQIVLGIDPRQVPARQFHVNAMAQPLVCAMELATWAALKDSIEAPEIFAGYSVGELVAYGCAGALDVEDVIRLAVRRAEAMDAACPTASGMMAVRGLEWEKLAPLCIQYGCEIAIVNDMDRLVIGGRLSDLAIFEPILLAHGAKVTHLKITIASHTSLMAAAQDSFRHWLAECPWRHFESPVLAGISGAPIRDRVSATETLTLQLSHMIDWAACLDGLAERGCTALLELGPGNGLSRMARERFPNIPSRSVSEFRTLDGIVNWVVHST